MESASALPLDASLAVEALPAVPRWKRPLDLLVLAVSAPVWLPLFVAIAVGLALINGRPIFFRQVRVGRGGRPFVLYKFRTMRTNADPVVYHNHISALIRTDTPMTKLDHQGDPRLVRFGPALRASGLDELPQIWNILRGEMSVVGPRPSTVAECSLYSRYERGRLRALPGLTGWWQVNGKNETTFQRMIELDNAYCDATRLGRDAMILARTAGVILKQLNHWLLHRRKGREKVQSAPVQSMER